MRRNVTNLSLAAGLVMTASLGVASAQAATLDDVKSRGQLRCGVTTGLAGFSAQDDTGTWKGIDVDVCRAVAAAVFADPSKVAYTPLTAKERFTALQSGEIDILSRVTTFTFSRDTDLKLDFAGVTYYDGQGFMVKKSLGVDSAKKLDGASICVQAGTTTELNLADYFRANNMKFNSVVFADNTQVRQAYLEGRCDAFTTDASGLAAERSVFPDSAEHIILPEIISKEPLGPVVRHGDNAWGDIVRWALYAMINAEELGVTSANVDEMKGSENPEIKRLLGVEGELGKMAGLSNDWAYQIIKQVGNYSEIFERNVGKNTPLKLDRGLNALWNAGGVQYAPPMR